MDRVRRGAELLHVAVIFLDGVYMGASAGVIIIRFVFGHVTVARIRKQQLGPSVLPEQHLVKQA